MLRSLTIVSYGNDLIAMRCNRAVAGDYNKFKNPFDDIDLEEDR